MSWNYRVIKDWDGLYEIHEVYYDDKGNIDNRTVKAIVPDGESVSELRRDLLYMLAALLQPVLDEKELDKNEDLPSGPDEGQTGPEL